MYQHMIYINKIREMDSEGLQNDVENASNGCNIINGSPDQALADRCFSFSHVYRPIQKETKKYPKAQTLLLAYQSIGVVYGDLGTSPTQVFSSITIKDLNEESLLGVLSLIIWSLTLLVLIKYVLIVLNADDHGEGGTFALYSNLCRKLNLQSKLRTVQDIRLESDVDLTYYSRLTTPLRARTKKFLERSSAAQSVLTFVVLLGTCMVIGDGALTPATCVLSALQGIQSESSKITQDQIVVMAIVLFIALFAFQRCGTSKVSFSFAPIMLLWYTTNVSIGIYNIIQYHPTVLKAISPHYIVKFFLNNGKTAWDLLGALYLCVTGAEALFADLGHFNKRAIQLAFSFVVYPSMILSYAGETAYLIHHPDKISDAYYSSLPTPVYWPMFVVSTLAAVVASQSMISATYSIVKQSMDFDCFPRVKMVYTSSEHEGQFYSPEINYTLMVLCVALVVGFKGGAQLTNAYGVVVIWVMIITTCLTTLLMMVIWETNPLLILAFFLVYITIEVAFMTSLLKKVPQGGWVPFVISAFFLIVMLSWRHGRNKKSEYEAENKMSLNELEHMLSPNDSVQRTPGICFFCTDLVNGIPPIIRKYIQHTNSVHEILVLITVRIVPIKTVLMEERLNVGKLGNNGTYRCLIQFGYKDRIILEGDGNYIDLVVAKIIEHEEITIQEKQKLVSAVGKGHVFVTGRTILRSNTSNGWVCRFIINYLYRFLQKNSRAAILELPFPPEKTLQVGMLYEL